MKLRAVIAFLIVAPAFLFLMSGCNTCSTTGEITFSATGQNFSISYVDTAGNNYLQNVYNLGNTQVLFNDNGGEGQFRPLSDDFGDGKFGPFTYTISPSPVAIGVRYDYWYILRKDTFKTDTFRIVFYPNADECQEFWREIKYFMNGTELGQFNNSETAELTIVE